MSGTLINKYLKYSSDLSKIIDKYLEENPGSLFNKTEILKIATANMEIWDFINNDPDIEKFVKAFAYAKNIQICFVVDVTASMKNFDILKKFAITQVISQLIDLKITGARRFSYIGYRERDEEYEFEQFEEDREIIYDAIKKTRMKGGGDMAEDVEFAFELLIKKLAFDPKVNIFYFLNFNKLD